MTLLVSYVLLAIGVSFVCSIAEAVLLSVTPSFVAAKAAAAPATARRLRRLKADIDRPLAAILSLNTIAHTVGAAGAGAQAAAVFGDASVGVFSAILTFLILVLSEIIPKTVGALYWRPLAAPVAALINPLIWALWPLVKLSRWITLLVSRGRRVSSISREEIAAMAKVGHEEGVVEESESRILQSLFRFRSLRVEEIMTPRTVAFVLHEKLTVGDVVAEHGELRFSRIPVFGQHRDDVTGYVLKDELLLKAAQGERGLSLSELVRPLLVVDEGLRVPLLLEQLLEKGEHIALVVDEYGGTEGLVTLEDVVETLLGLEIVDEVDSVEDLRELARQRWRRRAKRLGLAGEVGDGEGK